jgi:hypothetical protein
MAIERESDYHTYVMERTTVYLSKHQAEALRRTARATGRSQSDLIRHGVDLVTGGGADRPRFRFIGAADGPVPSVYDWETDSLYRHVMGLPDDDADR